MCKLFNNLTPCIYSNVLIAPCSTADPGIAGAVLLQNKPNTKIERLTILEKSCRAYKTVSQTII